MNSRTHTERSGIFFLEETKKTAYYIFLSGKNNGDQKADWQQAEADIKNRYRALYWRFLQEYQQSLSNDRRNRDG